LEGCSRAVNVSPIQIKLIPSHRKIRPPECILPNCQYGTKNCVFVIVKEKRPACSRPSYHREVYPFHRGLFEPLIFTMPLFCRRSFFLAPCIFGVASFFIGGLFLSPLHFLWLPLFSSEVFFYKPLAFWGCLLFHQSIFS
jgi:hypothetical protein